MKMLCASVGVILLLCFSRAAATQDAPTTTQPTAESSQPVQQQAPAAGPQDVPAPAPVNVPLVPIAKIKTIYIAPLPNDLDVYIRAEMAKQLKDRISVQLKPEGADATMAGTGEWKSGTGAAITGRWLGLHDTATGAVSLVGSDGSTVLWSSEAGDRSLWWGVMKRGGPRKVAGRLVSNLKRELNRAAKR